MAIGLFSYAVFLYFNAAGNTICDCETTENYKPTSGQNASVNRFYHK